MHNVPKWPDTLAAPQNVQTHSNNCLSLFDHCVVLQSMSDHFWDIMHYKDLISHNKGVLQNLLNINKHDHRIRSFPVGK